MNRYFRLDTGWFTSEWLIALSAEARLCWVLILGYVKAHGIRGRVKAINPHTAAQMWFVGDESIRQLLIAATKSGAIEETDGDWIVAKWDKFQSDTTGAERQRRFKERQKDGVGNGGNALVTAVTVEHKENIKRISPIIPLKGDTKKRFSKPTPAIVQAYMDEIGYKGATGEKFCDHYEARGWLIGKNPMKDWKAAVRTWRGNDKSKPQSDDGLPGELV